ncbi:hypothetical protein ACB092_02G109900 [Castanea dentata]
MGSTSSIYGDIDVQPHHVVLLPFMSQGHIIPILHLTRLLLHRRLAVTIFTTQANHAFITESLNDTSASILDLPFSHNVPDIPAGIESTEKLPSISLFHSFANATKVMQSDFERALQTLPHVSFMVSDGFLWWTLDIVCLQVQHPTIAVANDRLLFGAELDDELITVTPFPWIKVTRNDFEPPFTEPKPKGLKFEFTVKAITATKNSYGIIFNSFNELEPMFVDFWNRKYIPKAWSVGPLCLAEPPKVRNEAHNNYKPIWVQWLDKKLEQGNSMSPAQLKEIAIGLEESKVNFLWVIRKSESEISDEFEERVKDRGILVREWSMQGFFSHCGWNSVLESICAGVPILAWPMMAEQPLNARMVVEEIKVGLRVETCNGSVRGFVKWEGLEKMVKELMEGEMAKKTMEEGGSSECTLDLLIIEIISNTIKGNT